MDSMEIRLSGNAHNLYPTDTFYALFWLNDDDAWEVPQQFPFQGEWGEALSSVISLEEHKRIPERLSIIWLSIVEVKFYEIEYELPADVVAALLEKYDDSAYFIVGMAPYGQLSVWISDFAKSSLVCWVRGQEVCVSDEDFSLVCGSGSVKLHCTQIIDNDLNVKGNLHINGLPPRDLFDNYMKQFTYRYVTMFGKWNGRGKQWEEYGEKDLLPEFGWIEEALFDGTHDKLRDGGLMKYHEAGKPKKLAVGWHIGKSEYSAYFWFEDERIREVFDRFYGAHPDTKTDFIIRIDAEKRKYELALYRYGLKEPYVIPEDVYQLLVFKNKFEDYRSDNYNQERGAWIW